MMKTSQKNRQVEDQLCQINDGFYNKKKKKEKDISTGHGKLIQSRNT